MLLVDTAGLLPGMSQVIIRMGCVEQVWTTCADWLKHGPGLVGWQPVMAVRLTDREPLRLMNGNATWTDAGTNVVYSLPSAWAPFGGVPYLATPEDAHAWASGQAVAWARARAGLPPLVEVTP
jgi:hypothetical protein